MSQQPARQPLGMPFIELQSVDSTNNYARSQVHADLAHHGFAVFANYQTAGKGQPGKNWHSEMYENIALSLVIDPRPLPLTRQFELSAVIATGCRSWLEEHTREGVSIKWPNDIYWQDRKAAGILIESVIGSLAPVNDEASATGQWKWAIAGIGVNINQVEFPEQLPNPVSLKQITGKQFDTGLLARELCGRLNQYYNRWQEQGFSGIYEEYTRHLYRKGQQVKLRRGQQVFEATIITVQEDGGLVIRHSIEETVYAGSLEWVK